MKKFLLPVILFISGSLSAQMVYSDGNKSGIMFQSGHPALPAEYDRVHRVYAYGDDAYICTKDGKDGIYLMADSSFTGCRYDSVYKGPDEIIYLENDHRKGFLGYNNITKQYHFVEPQYKNLMVLGEYHRFGEDDKIIDRYRGVSVQLDSLWGVVDFATNEVRVPLMYPEVLDRYMNGNMLVSVDRKKNMDIIVDPFTGIEFRTSRAAQLYVDQTNDIVYAFNKYAKGDTAQRVMVWRYSTGKEIWRYSSHANAMNFTMYSDQMIGIEETYETPLHGVTSSWRCFNLVTGSLLMMVECGNKETLCIEDLPDRVVVHQKKSPAATRDLLTREILK